MKRSLFCGALCCALLITGCEGTPTGRVEPAKYTLFGLAEMNLDDDTDYLYLEFTADGQPVAGSYALMANDTLFFDTTGTISVSTPEVVWGFNADVVITVYDTAAGFSHTVSATIPSQFTIYNFIPPTHIYQGDNVSLEWYSWAGAAGYFVTCVARGADSEARGFAETVGLEGLSITIEPETFQERSYPFDRVVDSFYVFVIAYNPTYEPRPGSKYTDTGQMDFLDFSSSISGKDISGAFGAAVVSQREAIDVVALP